MKSKALNPKELAQEKVFKKLKAKLITQIEAASILGISTRQILKKMQRYVEHGRDGLIHMSRGKVSPKKLSDKKRKRILDLIRKHWHKCGPTFISMQLWEQYSIKISRESVRRLMIENNLWVPQKSGNI